MKSSILSQSVSDPEVNFSNGHSRSPCSVQAEAIRELSIFIHKLCPIIAEMKESAGITLPPDIKKAIESLETDYKSAKEAIDGLNIRSSPVKRIEHLTQNLGRSLALVLFASNEGPFSNKDKVAGLCKEMMNARYELTSNHKFDWGNEVVKMEELEEETDEKVEDENKENQGLDVIDINDVFMMIRSDDDDKFNRALSGLNAYIIDGMFSDDKLEDEGVVNLLCHRLSTCEDCKRVKIIQLLRFLASLNNEKKEKMVDLNFLAALIKSLSSDVDEQREAVGLLLNLCDDPRVRRRIGRIQGCVVMLVSIAYGDDDEASHDATILLNALSGSTQQTLYMAEAGYFKPLIKHLREGPDMSKILMATALARMELSDQSNVSLGNDGAIEPLLKMFSTGNLEAKHSSLNALQTLSTSQQNIQRLIDSGIVASLLQLLFSVTSVLMTLREPAAAMLAKVAESESILIQRDIAQQILSLLSLSSPVIQNHLLEALNNITSHRSASKVMKKMRENGAVQLLIPFFTETNAQMRSSALKLVYTLSKDMPEELLKQLGYSCLDIVLNILASSASKCETAAALGILSNLPVTDRKILELLKNAKLMHLLASALSSSDENTTPPMIWLSESIAGILMQFTVPANKRLQQYSVENGVIQIILKLLLSSSDVAKSKACMCLAQLSENSSNLSKSQKIKWFCAPPSINAFCEVHGGYCTVKSTFCLIKAGAIAPLIQILNGNQRGSDEGVLSCLATLLEDEIWEGGSNYIVKMKGVDGIIKSLELGHLKSREKALWILERILKFEAYRVQYGESARVVLADLAKNGDPMLKPTAAKLLAQLESTIYTAAL